MNTQKNYNRHLKLIFLLAVMFCAAASVKAQYGTICGDPSVKKCAGQYDDFKPNDLIFNTGRAALGVGTRHVSKNFYAVILESVSAPNGGGGKCNIISEEKRLAAQTMFPHNKVFSSRNYCVQTISIYENTAEDVNFMAVYAGATKASAAGILKRARQKYPTAYVLKMRAVLDFGDE